LALRAKQFEKYTELLLSRQPVRVV
jgi:hypothetical protein